MDLPENLPSPENITAFIALAEHGSIHLAAEALHLTDQGARSRLIALEKQLGVELYQKAKGRRNSTPLTRHGRMLLPHATALLEQSANLKSIFAKTDDTREVHVAASAYLTTYLLIDTIKKFHAAYPDIRIRLSTLSEQQIEKTLTQNPSISLGFAAPYESETELDYVHTITMDWSVLTPAGHPLLKKKIVSLEDLVDEPLILFEHGSTGRQHILDAFGERSLRPRIEMEATTTPIITRMVEAGLGLSIVPLLPNGAVTKNVNVGVISLGKQIRPILSGIFRRRNETLTPATQHFMNFIQEHSKLN